MILVVEDNGISAMLVERTLNKEGYETTLASNGREALEVLRSTPGIDLVVTDIMMPEVSGLELLRRMRDDPLLKGIRVIMTTVLTDYDTMKEAAVLGCRHYLAKPVDREALVLKVRESLSRERLPLGDKFLVMSKLDIDLATYRELSKAFQLQVDRVAGMLCEDEDAPAIEEAGAQGAGSLSPSLWDLLELRENAEMFGAQRIVALVDEVVFRVVGAAGEVPLTDAQRERLLAELRALREVL